MEIISKKQFQLYYRMQGKKNYYCVGEGNLGRGAFGTSLSLLF